MKWESVQELLQKKTFLRINTGPVAFSSPKILCNIPQNGGATQFLRTRKHSGSIMQQLNIFIQQSQESIYFISFNFIHTTVFAIDILYIALHIILKC